MKEKIKKLILQALEDAHRDGVLPSSEFSTIEVGEPKIEAHGDFSTNIAMVMASVQKMAPRKIAEILVDKIPGHDKLFDKVEIAGPGFINFTMAKSAWYPGLQRIHEEDTVYGAGNFGNNQKVQVEFVSANPTGPLHVGHGRGAAVGDSVARILAFCGYDVQREYYINDSGRQISTLGRSVFLRYRELFGEAIDFPEDCYQGVYINDFAEEIKALKEKSLLDLSARDDGGEEEAVLFCARFAAERILNGIKEDLKTFGIEFDEWFSEQKLYDSGKVDAVLKDFREQGIIYEEDGALWFKTSDFGDEKDRVVVRSNGLTTYFASDIAYHKDKFDRGFERVIDVWGADHHGYIQRMKASIEAAGRDKEQFDVILVQLVNLLRDGVPVGMSTRAGEFETLKDVLDEVGSDAARFIFLTRHYESSLDFDLEIAKKKTNDNPVYYVQYVHARISSIIRKGIERNIECTKPATETMRLLTQQEEVRLIKSMTRFPEIVKHSAELMEPHRITYFLMDLASSFHTYFHKHRVLTEDPALARSRLYLVQAVKIIIRNGLTLLGVTAPEKM